MKRWSVSLIILEMHFKTAARCHLTPVRKAIFKKPSAKGCWGCGGKRTLVYCRRWEGKWYSHYESSWEAPDRLKMDVVCDPVIPLTGMNRKEIKSVSSRAVYTPVFTAAFFTVVRIWQQPTSPFRDEWIKKVHIHTQRSIISHEKEGHPSYPLAVCDNMDGP